MSALSPVQRSRAVLGAGVRAVARAYRDTGATEPVATPRYAPFADALDERPASVWSDPLGPVTSDLYARLTDEDLAALEERLEPGLRGYWDPADEALRRRLALLFSLWYVLPGAIERTGLVAAMPPEGTHAMARGPLAAGGDLYTADLVATLLARAGIALDEGMTVLDFGSSSGRVLRVLNAWRPDLDCVGCDPNGEAIAWASEHLPGARWFVSPTSPPLELADGSVDVAYAISVWSHFAAVDAVAWLEEMHRVVAPGGALVLTTHGYHAVAEFKRRSQMLPDTAGAVARDFIRSGHAFFDVFGPEGDWGVKAEGWGNGYMTVDWLAQRATPAWSIRVVELGALDHVQDVVVLERV
jgi:SAM-dependent methyltransferase